METRLYGCYNKNETVRSKSSSGGIFPLLASYVIQKGGAVYGAAYDDMLEVRHIRISEEGQIPLLQGSKYVASKQDGTFRKVRQDLAEGRHVLYTGTPCQCEGLLVYLDTVRCSMENLLTADCVCHGVPGYAPWRAYQKAMEDRGFTLREVNMRDKSSGWSRSRYSWRLKNSGGQEKVIPRSEAPFMKGMLANLYCRPSCYTCPFKGIERRTDFTLGDYWGVWRVQPELDDNKGTSLVMVHSEKGQEVFDALQDMIVCGKTEADLAVQSNECILKSCSTNPSRDTFFQRLSDGEDFIEIIEDMTKESYLKKARKKAGRLVRKLTGR